MFGVKGRNLWFGVCLSVLVSDTTYQDLRLRVIPVKPPLKPEP